MLVAIEVISVLLVALSMSLTLAHALEYPGKLRLNRQTYLAVQTIYYPGFTVAGFGEPLSAIAILALLLIMRNNGLAFWWILASLLAVVAMHAVFWLVTQPANKYWLKNQQLGKTGGRFFGTGQRSPEERKSRDETDSPDWKVLRNRWEYSHIVRAILSVVSLATLTIAIAS